MGKTAILIRGIDEGIWQEIKVLALRKGCNVGQLVNEALVLRLTQDQNKEVGR